MWLFFLISLAISLVVTALVRYIALRLKIVDTPDGSRKRHTVSVPLLGGVALFVSFWLVMLYLLGWHPIYGLDRISNSLVAAFIGSLILVLIGIFDEMKPFSATLRLALTLLVIFIVAGWIGGYLSKITNPFGGVFELGLSVGTILTFVWLAGMTYTTKILDGLDGLATGVVIIGSLMIYFLTSTAKFYQPNVGLVALIFAGTCLGFLVFNFHPAKIFLGESGSLFVGFMLGILAVIGGGKLATALLVMAVPILDLARVMYVRLKRGQPIMTGDREHLHFKLLDRGWSERGTVLLYYCIATAFGATTLFLQSYQKLIALGLLVVAMIAIGWRIAKSPLEGGSRGV
ncbi:MAG: undecaprenyl/decaprenyl-phosphate alpha-N-acetylglucosaminyl 1-phosphate transferase [Candidatus Magasanikbacteria bacterium]|nr:undecaprenyl/decaprenyl-phosphate alpha-N-acetylglucosaminyl 1-phosphate transferase [Candidatus Magasanikbacteria bacterium]